MLQRIFSRLFSSKPVRDRRRAPKVGPRPAIGGYIARRHVMMRVTHPISGEHWDWLTLTGWREINPFKDRRKYKLMREDALATLLMADPMERDRVHRQLLAAYPDPNFDAQGRRRES